MDNKKLSPLKCSIKGQRHFRPTLIGYGHYVFENRLYILFVNKGLAEGILRRGISHEYTVVHLYILSLMVIPSRFLSRLEIPLNTIRDRTLEIYKQG